MSQPSHVPRLWTIPPSAPFLDVFAHALISGRLVPGDHELHDFLVLLPTRRACRALTGILAAKAGDGALLLPQIRPIGDVDEADLALDSAELLGAGEDAFDVPKAIAPLRRQVLLTELVLGWGRSVAQSLLVPGRDEPVAIPVRPGDAALLARQLAGLLDDFETEGSAFSVVSDLAPDDHAAYWQLTLEFLRIATEMWPDILRQENAVDPATRRDALLRAEAARLTARPPTRPVVAAGSTGAIPATAELLSAISRLPLGAVVLPGLDLASDDQAWTAIDVADAPHPGHPQYGLKRLLRRVGAVRRTVEPLAPPVRPTRERLVAEALRPATTTEQWARLNERVDAEGRAAALDGVSVIEAANEQEEATAIALVLREALDAPECRTALVTPDRGLARRVSSELARWGLTVDDSAGVPLAETPPGILLRLVADAAALRLAPSVLAALVHHPLARFGMATGEIRHAARCLELLALRGPRPAPGGDGLWRVVSRACAERLDEPRHPVVARLDATDRHAALRLAGQIAKAFAVLEELGGDREVALADLVARHRDAVAAIACDEGGQCPAFDGMAGEELLSFLDSLAAAAEGSLKLRLEDYPALLGVFMSGHTVRPAGQGHPRLTILGPLEARLLSVDLVVLGGLNEGTWPADTRTDPFLNRPMRTAAGLEAPERFIGLAAHDFAQLLGAPRVVLSRAAKAGGEPTVASRWWQRLRAVTGAPVFAACAERGACYLAWTRLIDRSNTYDPPAEPLPKPAAHARPDRLSVTEVETLIRDPYAIYAKRVLGLRPLDGIDIAPDAAMRGTLIHKAMSRFDAVLQEGNSDDPVATLVGIGEDLFGELADFPELAAVWWPRFRRVARWFAPLDVAERAALAGRLSEAEGRIGIDVPGGRVLLVGRADRIDIRVDGALRIVDYKTGNVPTLPQVQSGLAPQLPLEAAMARLGAFDSVAPGVEIAALAYVTLKGGRTAGEVREIVPKDTTVNALADAALANLTRMLARFADPAVPYRAKTHVQQLRFATDYDHLSRFAEWSVANGSEG